MIIKCWYIFWNKVVVLEIDVTYNDLLPLFWLVLKTFLFSLSSDKQCYYQKLALLKKKTLKFP